MKYYRASTLVQNKNYHVSVMKILKFIHLVTLLLITQNGSTYKILGVFHFPTRSHHILGSTLLKALADKGHDVTMLSPYPLEKPYPNYKDLELTGITELVEDPKVRRIMTKGQGFLDLKGLVVMRNLVSKINEFVLNHTVVKQLISSKQKFDVVIQVYFGNDAFFGLGHCLGAHNIAFSTIGSSEYTTELTKNPAPLSYIPTLLLACPSTMNFWQRVLNALIRLATQFHLRIFQDREQTLLLNKYIPNTPSIEELRNNVSLVFLNSHFAIEGSRAYLPNMVPIGGFHITPPNALTGEIKDFMDSASHGVILFSLGSNVKSSELSREKIEAILHTFSTLPQKVLWKFEASQLEVPSNVKILKWLPQNDILAHPNLKAFITHGGLLSTIEAVYHGVPMIGIPLFGDQAGNVNEAVNNGYAVRLDLNAITFERLSRAIKEVVENPRYRNAAQRLSKVFKDDPISPLNRAVYWVEYVVKHNGAHHLKPVAINLKWYQLNSLDVLGFITFTILCIVLLSFYVLCKISRLLKRKFCKVDQGDLHNKKRK